MKMQKSPNASKLNIINRSEISDTDSESEQEIKTLKFGNEIKEESQSSTDDSDSSFQENTSKQKIGLFKNVHLKTLPSEDDLNTNVRKNTKQETQAGNASSDSDNEKYIIQRNKYKLHQSTSGNQLVTNNQKKQVSQNIDDSSSESDKDTLRSAFLGQNKPKKRSSIKNITQQNVTNFENSSSEDTSSDDKNQSTLKANLQEKVNTTPVTLKSPKLQNTVPSPQKMNKKSTPKGSKQAKNKKFDTNIGNMNNSKTPEEIPTEIQTHDSENSVIDKSKVQVLQHIKLTPKMPQELFEELYPNLKPLQLNEDYNISNNEEVYLLQIPRTIDPQHLLNKELDLTGGSKLKIGKDKYDLEPTNKVPVPFLLVGNQSRVICPIDSFFLKKRMKLTKMPDIETIEKAIVPFPKNLKHRHPLFGSEYEDKIQLSSEVEERLQKAIENCLKQREKAKNKKKKSSVDHTQNEVIFSLLGFTTNKTSHIEEQYDSAFGSSESNNNGAHKKKTKIKSLNESLSLGANNSPISPDIAETVTKKKKSKNKQNDMESVVNVIKTELQETDNEVESPKHLIEELSIIVPPESHHSKKRQKRKEKTRISSVFGGEKTMFESTRIDVFKHEFSEEPLQEWIPNNQNLINETLKNIKTELVIEHDSHGEEKCSKNRKKKQKLLDKSQKTQIDNEILSNIKQEIFLDFNGSASKNRKRSLSVMEGDTISETATKKSKKSKKNSSFSEGRFSLDCELDNILEKVKRDKKMKA